MLGKTMYKSLNINAVMTVIYSSESTTTSSTSTMSTSTETVATATTPPTTSLRKLDYVANSYVQDWDGRLEYQFYFTFCSITRTRMHFLDS